MPEGVFYFEEKTVKITDKRKFSEMSYTKSKQSLKLELFCTVFNGG